MQKASSISGPPLFFSPAAKLASSCLILSALFILVSVFASTAYLAGFEKWHVVMPWRFPWWATCPLSIGGFFIFLAVVIKPQWFWPVLVLGNVVSSGMFVLRFSILDEWITLCCVAAGSVAAVSGRVPKRMIRGTAVWALVFLLMTFHFLIMGGAGMCLYGNLKAIRFILLFTMIFLMGVLILFFDFPIWSPAKITSSLVKAGVAFSLIYFIHAAFFYSALKCSIIDGIGYATSGYQVAPFLVTFPASIIQFANEKGSRRVWAMVGVGLSLGVIAFTDSRAGVLIVLGNFVVLPMALGLKRFLKISLVCTFFLPIVGFLSFGHASWFLDTLNTSIEYLNFQGGNFTYNYLGKEVTVAKGDGGRYLFFKTGCRFLVEEFPFPALAGAGNYGFFIAGKKQFDDLTRETRINNKGIHSAATLDERSSNPNIDRPRPPAAGAMMVETGWVGVLLFMGCFVFSFLSGQILTSNGGRLYFRYGDRLLKVMPLVLALGFTFFTELQDVVILYLMLAPFGIIHAWCQNQC